MKVIGVFDEDNYELGPVGSSFIAMFCSVVFASVVSPQSALVTGNLTCSNFPLHCYNQVALLSNAGFSYSFLQDQDKHAKPEWFK